MSQGANQKKFFIPTWILVSLMLLAACMIAILVVLGTTAPQSDSALAPTEEPVSASTSTPNELVIPSIGVHTHIESVGLTKAGNIQTPSSFKTVAWYKKSAAPGNSGASIIVGHDDNGLGLAAVFFNLKKLVPGDVLYVYDAQGAPQEFVVTHTQVYSYTETPPKEIFESSNNTSELHLITCSGNWVPSKRMYDQRLVIYAVKNTGL